MDLVTTKDFIKVKNDHRSKFSNLGNWKEEVWKNQGKIKNQRFNRVRNLLVNILHFHLQPQFKYELFPIYTSHQKTLYVFLYLLMMLQPE